ncbi:patatin-like phospholipase family protein [Eisenibacter elegans]|jgi:NTE family protein|uniref:patatin-like phospholipase family protein n=1 Tax=Eisenibacter elegans TaxID=997 RepID=UPI0004143886|nr:patatin-like phospholipase family protein [Eisenibacter elegans]
MAKQQRKSTDEKHLAVALQGGGAHGAFTWGVLDRLLEDERIILDGFSGTSAGAMNAALLAYGLHSGNRQTARDLLHKFWKTNSQVAAFSPLQPGIYDRITSSGNMDHSPGFLVSEMMGLFVSPYQSPLSDYNPLRDILTDLIDFDSLRKCKITQLFVAATNVRRGKVRVFKPHEISVDAVLASANLPFLFKAVTIDGEDYWDGGYMGNPPIFPLIDGTPAQDILIVQINPINIPETPKSSAEIRDRINELSFNSALMHEMRKIDLVDRLISMGVDLGGKFRKIYIHNINPEEDMHQYNVSSKLNATWDFLLRLRDLGRDYAERWIAQNFDDIGQRSTCNVREVFL